MHSLNLRFLVISAKPVPSVVLDAALAIDPSSSLASSATPASAQLRAHMLPVMSLITAELPVSGETNASDPFYPLTGQGSSDDFRKYIISYSRQTTASAAPNAATPTPATTEAAHPRRHRNRHQHTQSDDAVSRHLRQMALRRNNELFHAVPTPSGGGAASAAHASNHQHLQLVVLQTSKVAEMDDDVQSHHQQPIALDKLFQR
jgi:hypothetical protein